jgi:hypothetical protein
MAPIIRTHRDQTERTVSTPPLGYLIGDLLLRPLAEDEPAPSGWTDLGPVPGNEWGRFLLPDGPPAHRVCYRIATGTEATRWGDIAVYDNAQ